VFALTTFSILEGMGGAANNMFIYERPLVESRVSPFEIRMPLTDAGIVGHGDRNHCERCYKKKVFSFQALPERFDVEDSSALFDASSGFQRKLRRTGGCFSQSVFTRRGQVEAKCQHACAESTAVLGRLASARRTRFPWPSFQSASTYTRTGMALTAFTRRSSLSTGDTALSAATAARQLAAFRKQFVIPKFRLITNATALVGFFCTWRVLNRVIIHPVS
jgi:hypothetical protein